MTNSYGPSITRYIPKSEIYAFKGHEQLFQIMIKEAIFHAHLLCAEFLQLSLGFVAPEQSCFRLLRSEEIAARISDVKLGGATTARMPYGISISVSVTPDKSTDDNSSNKVQVLKTVELFSWSQVL